MEIGIRYRGLGPYDVKTDSQNQSERMLAYILSKADTNGLNNRNSNRIQYNDESQVQIALWYFMQNYGTDLVKANKIPNNVSIKNDQGYPNSVYNEAFNLSGRVRSSTPILTVNMSEDNKKLIVNVKNLDSNATIKVDGGDTHLTQSAEKDKQQYEFNINGSDSSKEVTYTVTLSISKEVKTVKYNILYKTNKQTLLLIDSIKNDTIDESKTVTITKKSSKPCISLQKFITKVNNESVESRSNRKSEYYGSDTKELNDSDDETKPKTVSNTINKDLNANDKPSKLTDAICINKDNVFETIKVEYQIDLYNNNYSDTKEITDVTILDTLPKDGIKEVKVECNKDSQISSVYDDKAGIIEISGIKIEWHTEIYVTVEFDVTKMKSNVIYYNKAEIISDNDHKDYRFEDFDFFYIESKDIDARLEKYVYQVNRNGQLIYGSDDRAHKQIYKQIISNENINVADILKIEQKDNGKYKISINTYNPNFSNLVGVNIICKDIYNYSLNDKLNNKYVSTGENALLAQIGIIGDIGSLDQNGNVRIDGKINSDDAILLLRYLNGYEDLNEDVIERAIFAAGGVGSDRQDDLATIFDVLVILRRSAGLKNFIYDSNMIGTLQTVLSDRFLPAGMYNVEFLYKTKDDNVKTETVENAFEINPNTRKLTNPVEVKLGDEVTYRVNLINETPSGQNLKLKISEIIDNADSELEYSSGSYYDKYEEKWKELSVDGSKIKFEGIVDLGDQVDTLSLTYKVNKLTQNDELINNTAVIEKCTIVSTVDENNKREILVPTPRNNEDSDWIKIIKDNDVSLQKYIVNVGDSDVSPSRENKKALDNSINEIYLNGRTPVTSNIENFTLKSENPVEINIEDSVTYKIVVYNNKSYNVEKVTVIDSLPQEISKLVSVKDKDGNDIHYRTDESNNNKLYIENIDLAGYESKEIYITVNFSLEKLKGKVAVNDAKVYVDNNISTYRTKDSDYVKLAQVDISLQKCIFGIGNSANELTENFNSKIGNRSDKKADNNTKDPIYHDFRNNKDIMSNGETKISNPVEINSKNIVGYEIVVYNNSEKTNATNIKIKDTLPEKAKRYYVLDNIDDFANNNIKWQNVPENREITLEPINVNKKDKSIYIMFVEFDDKLEGGKIYTNTAEITGADQVITSKYRQKDSDYVTLIKVDLGLQKYITQIKNGNVEAAISGRENRKADDNTKDPIYKSGNTDVYSSGTNKIKDPVYIDPGDIIEYTIKVYNNGDKTATNVIVEDILPNEVSKYGFNKNSVNNVIANDGKITLPKIEKLEPGESKTITVYVKFKDSLPDHQTLKNTAKLTDSDQEITDKYRTEDSDYVEKAIYAVSLEKYITKVDSTSNSYATNAAKDYGTGRSGKAEHKYDNDTKTNDYRKKDETLKKPESGEGPVLVNSGDKVTYKIVVKNSGNVPVKITEINDVMDAGINSDSKSTQTLRDLANETIQPGESKEITKTFPITARQITFGILENNALITKMQNAYGKDVTDTTLNDNKDADYIKLKGITISGFVWEETSNTKGAEINGLYDNNETLKSGIRVILQQSTDGGKNFSNTNYIATTDSSGKYVFEDVPHSYKDSNGNYNFYSYRVVFEYDGVTFTNAEKGEINDTNTPEGSDIPYYKINSNAYETESVRNGFNAKFAEIRSDGAYDANGKHTGKINYYTLYKEPVNNKELDPMSIHEYDDSFMKISSATDTINLANYSKNNNVLDYLKYINFGLRGKDVFDLSINNEIQKVDVTVNGVTGTYDYSSKGITIRQSDLYMTDDINNMNGTEYTGNDNAENNLNDQNVRDTDMKALNGIRITYKIEIKNSSQTNGQATRIKNYYDSKLTFEGYHFGDEKLTKNNSSDNNNVVTITMPDNMLTQEASTYIYIVYSVKDIKNVVNGTKYYNMAEIESYKTGVGDGQTEFTKGLIDQDSAPASADKEQVRTTENIKYGRRDDLPTEGGNPTTKGYYFAGDKDLSILRMEDDTEVRALKINVIDNAVRTIKGTVFEDDTKVTENKRYGDGKLGNKYDENGNESTTPEDKISGIEVSIIPVGTSSQGTITTTTNDNGEYTFTGLLPGEYTIEYTYCGKKETIYYNGQAYQSTIQNEFNEKVGSLKNADQNSALNPENYWYLIEGYSVATDNGDRREEVTKNWQNLNGEVTEVFKYINDKGKTYNPYGDDGIVESGLADIIKKYHPDYTDNEEIKTYVDDFIEKNKMFAQTKEMKIELEKPTNNDYTVELSHTFGDYNIENANFGIALRPKNITNVDIIPQKLSLETSDGTLLVSAKQENDGFKIDKGNIIVIDQDNNNPFGHIDIAVSSNLLHGALWTTTYQVTVTNKSENNYDGYVYAPENIDLSEIKIEEMRVFLDDKLIYNPELTANRTDNKENWTLETSNLTLNKENMISANNNALTKDSINNKDKNSVSANYVVTQILTGDDWVENNFNEATEIGKEISNNGRVPENSILGNSPKPISNPDDEKAGQVWDKEQEVDTGIARDIVITSPRGEDRNYMPIVIVTISSLAVVTLGVLGIKKFLNVKRQVN